MAEEEAKSPLDVLSSIPFQPLLTALITFQSAESLTKDLPGLFGPSPDYFGTLINVAFLGFGINQAAGIAGIGKKDYYAELEDSAVKSFAREAGEFALKGEVPTMSKDGRYEVATFAGGCFWGTELHYQRLPGVIDTCVGYTQGAVEKPSYEQVCSGLTGHTEALQLTFAPEVISYEQLCDKLFNVLGTDATELNRVGRDAGTQYRHGVYPNTDAQADAAARALARCQAKLTTPEKTFKVVTEIKRQTVFWPAEPKHQRYLQRGGQSAEKLESEPVRCYG